MIEQTRRSTTILYTGGTIGCIGTPLAPMPGEAFRDACVAERIGADAVWTFTERALDSAEMTPADWGAIAARVAGMPGPALVLQGTDTMAWSAAALAYLLTEIDAEGHPRARHAAPVVLTGAQRPLFGADARIDPESDAADNLIDSLATLDTLDHGVHLVFGGKRLPGARLVKEDARADAAFAAPNGLGRTAHLPPTEPERLTHGLARLAPHLGARAVLPVQPAPGPPGATAEALQGAAEALGERLGAVHLIGFGLGTMPESGSLGPVLADLSARGVLVALSSRVHRGAVAPDLYAASSWLADVGAVPTGDMTLPAAQAKLAVGLAHGSLHGWPRETFAAYLTRPIAGEITA